MIVQFSKSDAVVFATAFIYYHSFFILSRTFFIFSAALLLLFCSATFISYHSHFCLSRTFFNFFSTSFWLLRCRSERQLLYPNTVSLFCQELFSSFFRLCCCRFATAFVYYQIFIPMSSIILIFLFSKNQKLMLRLTIIVASNLSLAQ